MLETTMAMYTLSKEIMIETLRIYEACGKSVTAASRAANIPRKTFDDRLSRAFQEYPDGLPDKATVGQWMLSLIHISEPTRPY